MAPPVSVTGARTEALVCPGRRRGAASAPHQWLVAKAVGLVGLDAQTLLAIRLVVAEVALPPTHLGVTLEGQDVGGDAVEEPAVVADDQDAPGKAQQGLFQGTQGIDIEVVGRLVEQQHVAPGS